MSDDSQSHHHLHTMKILEKENTQLREENHRLQQKLSGQKTPWSDDTMDGITWVIMICVACVGVVFYLASMPS